jgi:hypothetical protein
MIIFSTILLVALCCTISLPSCANSSKQESSDSVEQQDAGTAISRDSLVTLMLNDLRGIDDIGKYTETFERQSAAIKSYWIGSHQGEDQAQMAETVFNEFKSLADSLGGGSTVDMMQSGEIMCAMYRYLTASEYCGKYQDNPLYQEEMRDWLLLENGLNEFYSNLAQVAYWRGSIVNVIISGTMSSLADARHADYLQLYKGGKFAESSMPITEARTNLVQEITDARSVEVETDADEDFKHVLTALNESGDRVVELLDKWLVSRNKLCESLGVLESHTASLIDLFSRRIQEIIEN